MTLNRLTVWPISHVYRISKDRMRFSDNLDVVKFVCKEVWMFLFKKQVDNLKTNHRVRRVASRIHHTVVAASMDSAVISVETNASLSPAYPWDHLGRLRASGQ